MAGITLSSKDTFSLFWSRRVREIVVAFTADGSGDATVDLSTLTGESEVVGFLVGAKAIPDGTTAPSADWDAYVQDPDGIDLLGAGLVNCSATAGKLAMCSVAVPVYFDLTVTVAGAGDGGKGVIKLLIMD